VIVRRPSNIDLSRQSPYDPGMGTLHHGQNSAACLRTALLFVVACWGLLLPQSYGQVTLTGLLQQGAEANGQTAGSPIWNTLGNEISFANLYVTQPNAGYTAPFLNHGNGTGASISYLLEPGTYQFYFFCDAFPNNNPGVYGLNLFFDSQNVTPGIAAFSPTGVTGANAVPAESDTLPLSVNINDPDPAPGTLIYTATPVPAPGTLTYTADDLSVTLTSYGFGQPGIFGGPALDRVGDLNDAPDGDLDGVGVFTLDVTPVPEPSSLVIAFGLVCPLLARRASAAGGRGR
jgi:hypothetical protein